MRPRKPVNKRRKQVRKPKQKVRDKFFFEDRPGVDIDFIEIPLPTGDGFTKEEGMDNGSDDVNSSAGKERMLNLEEFIFEYANRYLRQKDRPYGDLLRDKRRIEKLQYKLDKAASTYFTDIQFKVYVLRYKCYSKEKDIAIQLGCNQSHVAHILKGINKKFTALLRLDKKKHQYRKRFIPPDTPPKK